MEKYYHHQTKLILVLKKVRNMIGFHVESTKEKIDFSFRAKNIFYAFAFEIFLQISKSISFNLVFLENIMQM